MLFTSIYALAALIFLIIVFLVAYRMRGVRFALGLSLAAIILLGACYLAFAAIASSQM